MVGSRPHEAEKNDSGRETVVTRKEAIRVFNIRETDLVFFEKTEKITLGQKRRGYTFQEFRGLSRCVREFY